MMDDNKILISHIKDLKIRCDENSMIIFSTFLDLNQQSAVKELEGFDIGNVNTFYYGGYPDAERVCVVFAPSFYDLGESIFDFFNENDDENNLTLLKLSKDKFSSVNHRDYLGALMGLGIKREVIGDIIVLNDCAYVVTLKSSAKYIIENLKSVGKATVSAEYASFSALSSRSDNFLNVSSFVASERLDNIVSAAFSLSRKSSVSFIQKGLVFVNSKQILKNDFNVSPGDKVVVRGLGKVLYFSKNGKSKKDRIHITLKKYI